MRNENGNSSMKEIGEVIALCGLYMTSDGHVYAKWSPSKKQRAFMQAHKEEIEAELRRRREEEEAKRIAKAQAKKQLKEQFENGEITAKVYAEDAENYTYYTVDSDIAELLFGTGLVRYNHNGIEVPREVVEALGMEFTYTQVQEYLKKQEEKKAALESKQQEKVQAALEEAQRTGKQVVIRQIYTDCDGSVEECSTDIRTEYAMPDGTIRVTRTHTF